MKVQKIEESQRHAYKKLIRLAFESNKNNYQDLKFPDQDFPIDWMYGAFENGQLIGGAINFDFDITLRSSVVKMGGVADVVTKPEFRNRGVVRHLMDCMFKEMCKNNVPLSLLYPFKFSYWEKFGYKLGDENELYQFPIKSIVSLPAVSRSITEVETITEDIKKVYSQFADRYNLMAIRKDMQWKEKAENNFKYICYDDNQRPTGYLLLSFLKDRASSWRPVLHKQGQSIHLREMFWLDDDTKIAIFNFLKSFRDHREYISFNVPTGTPIVDLLDSPRVDVRTIRSNSMVRIVDVKSILQAINYPVSTFSFSLQVHDQQCSWNNKTFAVNCAEKRIDVGKIQPESRPDLEADIGSLSQIVAGFRTVDDLVNLHLIKVNPQKQESLNKLFPRQQNFMRDFF